MTIEAMPTTYHGIRFRSKLEARWAFFMDELDIGWDYEPNGPNTAPDFAVYDAKYTLMEVKGGAPSDDYVEYMRRVKCYIIAVGGFFKKQQPLILKVTTKGVRPIPLTSFIPQKSTGQILTALARASQHRFDLRRYQ